METGCKVYAARHHWLAATSITAGLLPVMLTADLLSPLFYQTKAATL